jgi:hypothetical protein
LWLSGEKRVGRKLTLGGGEISNGCDGNEHQRAQRKTPTCAIGVEVEAKEARRTKKAKGFLFLLPLLPFLFPSWLRFNPRSVQFSDAPA